MKRTLLIAPHDDDHTVVTKKDEGLTGSEAFFALTTIVSGNHRLLKRLQLRTPLLTELH